MLIVVKMAKFRRLSKSGNFKLKESKQLNPAVYDACMVVGLYEQDINSNLEILFENIAKRMKIEGMTGNMFM